MFSPREQRRIQNQRECSPRSEQHSLRAHSTTRLLFGFAKLRILNPNDPEPYLFMGRIEVAAPNPLACVEQKLARFVELQPANPARQLLLRDGCLEAERTVHRSSKRCNAWKPCSPRP